MYFLISLRHSGRYCFSFPIRKGPGLRGGLSSKPCYVQRESPPGVLALEGLWSFLDFYLPGGLNSYQCLHWAAVAQHNREPTCFTFCSKEATGKNDIFSEWLYLLWEHNNPYFRTWDRIEISVRLQKVWFNYKPAFSINGKSCLNLAIRWQNWSSNSLILVLYTCMYAPNQIV